MRNQHSTKGRYEFKVGVGAGVEFMRGREKITDPCM